MLHVNNRDGFTIAVSENEHLARIAKRTVLSDNAFSIVLPMAAARPAGRPRRSAGSSRPSGLTLQEWDKVSTDRITLTPPLPLDGAVV